jgi:hypothetical protein
MSGFVRVSMLERPAPFVAQDKQKAGPTNPRMDVRMPPIISELQAPIPEPGTFAGKPCRCELSRLFAARPSLPAVIAKSVQIWMGRQGMVQC